MATTTPLTRRTPTQRQQAQGNPFRSTTERTRTAAAQAMVEQREREVERLRIRLAMAAPRSTEARTLRLRVKATENNLRAWHKYLASGAPQCRRAVIIPD